MSVRAALAGLLLLAGCDREPRAVPLAEQAPIHLTVGSDGVLRIGDRPTTIDRLTADLRLLGASPQDARIYIRGDSQVLYKDFMAIMNALQDDGFYSVALVGEDQGRP